MFEKHDIRGHVLAEFATGLWLDITRDMFFYDKQMRMGVMLRLNTYNPLGSQFICADVPLASIRLKLSSPIFRDRRDV